GLRWRINILSLGDDDAASLGVNPGRLRALLLTMVALMTAGAVAVPASSVGRSGGSAHRPAVGRTRSRISMPTTFVLGAAYLTIIDTLLAHGEFRRDSARHPHRDHRCAGIRSAAAELA
ncbi:iron chelate uptake ABC transporter family permease subunit, partial [Rhodococcus hoagii]|nr:iron chelate uptake ABC transporter family permease subunit [Prescottella equi]NKZ87847.1 iron chelate uptake ABC transporter family permease subunit [Prescottella equi]